MLFSGYSACAEGLSSDELDRIISRYSVRTADELLGRIPSQLLEQHIFIYKSGSLHGASPLFPRVAVFSEDAKFILTFNGGSKQNHFFDFDAFEYDDETATYEARDIIFDPDGINLARIDREPQSCVFCHSSSIGIQPLRQKYIGGIFPGIYGSTKDVMSPIEKQYFEEFLNTTRKTGRYFYLPEFVPSKNWPLALPVTMSGIMMNRRHFEGVAKYLGKSREIRPYRYALLASLECTRKFKNEVIIHWDPDISNYLPKEVGEKFLKPLSEFLASSLVFQNEKLNQFKKDRIRFQGISFMGQSDPLSEELERDLLPKGEEASGSLQFLLKQLMPDSPILREIDIIAESGSDEVGGTGNLAQSLFPELLDSNIDQELVVLHKSIEEQMTFRYSPFQGGVMTTSRLCNLLKEKSLESLGLQ